MADLEEPQFNTLQERIAALNRQKNFKAPPSTAGKRAPPPPPPNRSATDTAIHQDSAVSHQQNPPTPSVPPRPTRAHTEKAPPLPRRSTEQDTGAMTPPSAPGRTPPPPLPSRNSHLPISPPPSLPSRRPSGQLVAPGRRNSNSSEISHISTISNLSLNHTPSDGQPVRRLPPSLDQAKLPPLPPTKREREAKAKETAQLEAGSASPSLPSRSTPRIAEPPSLPPRLPSRPGKSPAPIPADQSSPALPARRLPPPPATYRPKSALENGFGGGKSGGDGTPPPIPLGSRPPPVPLTSRPTAEQIEEASARTTDSCLLCRDFSEPDRVAAQYPLHSLPRQDVVGYLAHVLCDPFPSATDKARAIFTWEHHNIFYDVHGLFNNCIPRGQSPDEMIFSGKAVCEGYARVYMEIAKRAGLDCIMVCGHGKGFGFHQPTPGSPPPPRDPTGHAWNAVRIDGGEWKLLDACWGAGHLGENQTYKQKFNPTMFTLPNEIIGLRHYPADSRHFFRADGRVPSWEEYVMGPLENGETPPKFCGFGAEEGLAEHTTEPRARKISVRDGRQNVRFQISWLCPHWNPERNGRGKPYLYFIRLNRRPGEERKGELVPLETDGFWFWADIPAAELGVPGQNVIMCAMHQLDGRDARGLTREYWESKKGCCGYSSSFIATWDLVG